MGKLAWCCACLDEIVTVSTERTAWSKHDIYPSPSHPALTDWLEFHGLQLPGGGRNAFAQGMGPEWISPWAFWGFASLLPASFLKGGRKAPTFVVWLSTKLDMFSPYFFQALMAMCACCRLRCLGPAVTGLILKSAGVHWHRVARLMGVVQRWLEDACVRHAQNLPIRWMWRCFEYRKL